MADCADANIASIRELSKTADTETLREVVNILCDRLQAIDDIERERTAEIKNIQGEIRRMSGAIRGR